MPESMRANVSECVSKPDPKTKTSLFRVAKEANFTLKTSWWARRESNPHGFLRRILSPLRLPFRHSPYVVSRAGFEPATLALKGRYSTAELPAHKLVRLKIIPSTRAKGQTEKEVRQSRSHCPARLVVTDGRGMV